MDILSIGEALIDFTPGDGENTYIKNFGGAPANLAIVASRLGARTGFVGKVGTDAFGEYIAGVLEKEHVDISGLAFTREASTTLAFVHLDHDGERSFQFVRSPGADMLLCPGDILEEQVASARIVHFGSAQLMLPSGRDACDRAVRLAHAHGKAVSFDPNYRPQQWEDASEAVGQILRCLREADLVKLSMEELKLLAEETDLKRAYRLLGCRYGSLLVVSDGARGAGFCCGGLTGFVPGYCRKAVDTTGAGDAFWGAVLAKLCSGGSSMDALDETAIRDAIAWGNAAGALCVTGKGAVPQAVCRSELRRLLAA